MDVTHVSYEDNRSLLELLLTVSQCMHGKWSSSAHAACTYQCEGLYVHVFSKPCGRVKLCNYSSMRANFLNLVYVCVNV